MGWLAAALSGGLSAALYTLAFPPARWRLLAYVALVPLLVAVRRAGPGGALLAVLCWAQAGAFGVATALPASIERYFAQPPVVAWGLALVVMAGTSTVYYLPLAPWVRALAARFRWALPLLVAAAFAALELARARLMTGGGFWGNPWALIGSSQVGWTPMLQVASVGGVAAVGFAAVAANAGLAEAWLALRDGGARGVRRAAAMLAIGLAPAAGSLVFGLAVLAGEAPPGPGRAAVTVAVIQADVDLGAQWSRERYGRNLDLHLGLTAREVAASGAEIAVWPESALTFHLERDAPYARAIGRALAAADLELLAGGPSGRPAAGAAGAGDGGDGGDGERYFNSVFALGPDGSLRGRYDKERLVPFSEYVPLRHVELLRRRFDGVREFTPGTPTDPLPTRAGPAGVLLCNEGMLADLAAARARAGATWLVSPSNDSWIAGPRWADLTFDLVALRAVETRRPLVRASSSGPSGFVDPYGRVLARTAPSSRTTLSAPVVPRTGLTPYARFGDAFGAGCALAVGGALLRPRRTGRRQPSTRKANFTLAWWPRRVSTIHAAHPDPAPTREAPGAPTAGSLLASAPGSLLASKTGP